MVLAALKVVDLAIKVHEGLFYKFHLNIKPKPYKQLSKIAVENWLFLTFEGHVAMSTLRVKITIWILLWTHLCRSSYIQLFENLTNLGGIRNYFVVFYNHNIIVGALIFRSKNGLIVCPKSVLWGSLLHLSTKWLRTAIRFKWVQSILCFL